MKTNVEISDILHKKIKQKALDDDTTFKDLIAKALEKAYG